MRLVRAVAFLLLALAAFGAAAQPVQMPDFKRLERDLKLKPHQREQYDVAVAALKRSLIASAGTLMELKQQLSDELAKGEPDFRGLLRRQAAAFEINAPIYREAGDEWSKLYALLEDDQVVIAKRFFRRAMEEAVAFSLAPFSSQRRRDADPVY